MQYAAFVPAGFPTNKSPKLKSASGNPDAEGTYTNPKPGFPFIRSSCKRRGYTDSVITI
jgi:hypothetical protein